MSKVAEVQEGWLRHRLVLHKLLEQIGDEHTHFKPWEGAFSMGELGVHIATSMDMFVQTIKSGELMLPEHTPEFETMRDVRQIVHDYTNFTRQQMALISDAQLKTIIEMNHFYAPAGEWLENARDHEIHHKGQLFTYARMTGVTDPPFFITQPPKTSPDVI
ncbi:DinB family protein [Thalassobacillus sp. CUG 92003]|uniref:DinB family protein n=1 Tax=Thalassobacillus sp. CUG 92003 TaxID=2736641 RepID=UPI0015E639F6|nr:DinB family protein [Thalassobacillus sp. CUG 92003]